MPSLYPPDTGGGQPGAPPPYVPPPGGGGQGGNPFMATLHSQTPVYGRRWPQSFAGAPPQSSPLQFQGPTPPWASPGGYGPAGLDAYGGSSPLSDVGGFQPSGPPIHYPNGFPPVTATTQSQPQPYSPTGTPRAPDPYHKPGGAFSPVDLMQYLIATGYQGGAYDPEGSSAIHNALRMYLEQQGQGDIHKAGLGAQMYGYEDPMGQQYVRQNAEQSVRDRIAGALSQGDLQSMLQNQGFLQQLMAAYQQTALSRKPIQPDTFGAAAGQVGGAAVGAGIAKLFAGKH